MTKKMGVAVLFPLLIIFSLSASISSRQLLSESTILELNDSNFDNTISTFDYILVDFYAPWCRFSKLLDPELEKAAPVLAGMKNSITIAKINMDANHRIASEYKIDAYPTLKLFMHGVPTNYNGSRNADILVQRLKEMVDRDVADLDSRPAVIASTK